MQMAYKLAQNHLCAAPDTWECDGSGWALFESEMKNTLAYRALPVRNDDQFHFPGAFVPPPSLPLPLLRK